MSGGNRMAGTGLINWFMTDPLGEEVGEGIAGGLLAGLPGLAADQSLGQTALQTAAAIAGGIGLGIAGRRIGAWAGGQIHEKELKNQGSMLATLGRTLGAETTSEGIGEQMRFMRGNIRDAVVADQSMEMLRNAAIDPAGFIHKYGISPEVFTRLFPSVQAGRSAQEVLKRMEKMDPEARKKLIERLTRDYGAVEGAVTRNAAESMDERLTSLAGRLRNAKPGSEEAEARETFKTIFNADAAEALESLRGKASPVTGRHVGRAIGRLIGDEVGVLSGLAAGRALASALGMQSPKDRRIEELERQLQQQGAAA